MAVPEVIPRERLASDLARGPSVWIWGVAGAGKTTLVHAFFGARRQSVRTHHLEPSDRDPTHFFSRIAALFPASREVTMDFPGMQLADPVIFSRHFWSRIWALAKPSTILILEDHHELSADPIQAKILREAIVAIPAGTGHRLIVTSRDRVPEALTELALLGALSVIGDAELRLTQDEARALTVSRLSSASDQQCDALYQKSLGWVACHVLLIEHLVFGGTLDDVPDAAGPLSLYDYLAREVISALTPEESSVLVAAALLSRATSPLVARVTGHRCATEVLRSLVNRGLVAPNDAESCVQVHPLLAAASCRLAAEELGATAWRARVLRAAVMLAAEERHDEAIQLALRHQLTDAACEWVKQRAWSMLSSGHVTTLLVWLSSFTPETIASELQLAFWHAVVTDFGRDRQEHLEAAYRSLVAAADWHAAYTAWTWIANERATGMEVRLTAEWLAELEALRALASPPEDSALLLQFERTRRLAALCGNREPLTVPAVREIIHALAREPANPAAICNLLWKTHYVLGIADAALLLLDVREALGPRAHDPLAVLTISVSEALVALANGRYLEGMDHCQRSQALCGELGIVQLDAPISAALITGALGAGDLKLAAKSAQNLLDSPNHGGNFGELNRHFALSLSALRLGNLPAAKRHIARAVEFAAAMGCAESRCHAAIGETQIVAATSGLEAADILLESALLECTESGLIGLQPTLSCLSAYFALAAGDRERAAARTREMLADAVRAGGMIPGLDPKILAEVLAFALEQDLEQATARWLIQALQLEAPVTAGPCWPWELEVRVLGDLALARDGECIDAPTGRARELLCAIAALGAREVPITTLCDMLWPDAEGDAARRAFDTTLHRLRQHPALRGVLELKAGRVGLSRTRVWVDAQYVRRAAAGNARSDALRNAYRAELLENEIDYTWLPAIRDELKARVARARRL